jgi:hypothetical protein
MTITTQQKLTNATSSSDLAVALATIRDDAGNGFGNMLSSAYTPGFLTRSGLTSSATHIEVRPGMILAVLDAAGAVERTVIHAGVAAPGQVLVTYSAEGIPTLVFGDGANTGYRVLKLEGPVGLAEKLALPVFY